MWDEVCEISRMMERGYQDVSGRYWVGSPFEWIWPLSSARKGKIGERFFSWLCANQQIPCEPSRDRGYDKLCRRLRIEVKFSMLWCGKSHFAFMQLRPDGYDYVFLLGLAHDAAHGWLISKEESWERADPQHRGHKGSDTRMLILPLASAEPTSLQDALHQLKELTA